MFPLKGVKTNTYKQDSPLIQVVCARCSENAISLTHAYHGCMFELLEFSTDLRTKISVKNRGSLAEPLKCVAATDQLLTHAGVLKF